MRLELLVSTMNQKDLSLISKMNISTDAIIINQSNFFDYTQTNRGNSLIRMITFNERGVGRSRNNALMRSSADICLLADDDVVYDENYENIILEEFKKNPQADVIIFRVKIIDNSGERIGKYKNRRARIYNILKHGAVRVAFRREKVLEKNIHFTLLFGGGAKYGSGEDTIFLTDCLKKGLKVWTSSQKIADVYNYESSWFSGYNEKFFKDKGALFQAISPKLSYLLILQFALRKYSMYKKEMKLRDALRHMIIGRAEFKT